MQLSLQTQDLGDILIIRCQGRIVVGEEIRALQLVVEEVPIQSKKVVLHLAEVHFIDSAGIGALVRLLGVLRAHGGDLKVCQASPFVRRVLEITNLLGVLPDHASEQEAAAAFGNASHWPNETFEPARTRIVCTDSSHDLLAYLKALLTRSGYEVLTTRRPSEASTLVKCTKPHLVICGPGMQENEFAMDGLRKCASTTQLLLLSPDFSSSDAGHAGSSLVDQVRSLIRGK